MITFEFTDGTGREGTISVPEPKQWHRRWAARVAVRLWMWAFADGS